jgi:hypothetical protein
MAPVAVESLSKESGTTLDTDAIKKATAQADHYDIYVSYKKFESEHPEFPTAKYPA